MTRLALILLSLIAVVAAYGCSDDAKVDGVSLPIDELCAGDIVFRRGEGVASDMVDYSDVHGQYSHVGVVALSDSGSVVVHAVPGRVPGQSGEDIVRAEKIESFFSAEQSTRGEIRRLTLDSVQRSRLNRAALEIARRQVEFDHSYSLEDTTKLYCTELLQRLFADIGVDLAQGRISRINMVGLGDSILMPSDIYFNDGLKTIFSY